MKPNLKVKIGKMELKNPVMAASGAFGYAEEFKDFIDLNKLGAIVGRFSKVGINATILPGIKIGKNTWISPGEVVRYDVDDKTYLSNGDEKINLKI